MMFYKRLLSVLALVAMFTPSPVLALEDQVRALQQPVWVVSGGERSAAFPGQRLNANDEVMTGDRGKVILRLAEGSDVKLGNNAHLTLDIAGMAETGSRSPSGQANASGHDEGLYEAALDVLEGAFRFTTTELGKRFRRDLDIRVGPVATIGIRGTDVWGRAGADSSFVALIEGNISVTRRDGSELALNEPLTVFEASTAKPEGTTRQVSLSAVQKLAPETELDRGQGVLEKNGSHAVHLKSFRSRGNARRAMEALRERGYAASLVEARVNGEQWHRVSVHGFVSLADARAFAKQAREAGLASGPWVAASP